ncbi:MAG TPA: hypothetical protein VK817_02940 [Trebonia sp.]|jgi:hypothetical protein|nr:hypothetical protein [Trebonia sp.]
MKVTIIDGTPEELAEYEARTGLIGRSHVAVDVSASTDDVIAEGVRSFILDRARTQFIGEQVEAYVRRVLGLGGTEVEIGTSATSKDGQANYLRIYDAGSRRFGAVAYVSATNAGLTLRLTKDDVVGITGAGIKLREVKENNGYQVNCALKTSESLDLAVKLTLRALEKVR